MRQEVNEQWPVGPQLLSLFHSGEFTELLETTVVARATAGGGAACRVKSLCVPSMEFGSVLLTFLLPCFSSDQLRDVPVLHLPAGAAAAETQRVELLRLLLGKIHPATQKYAASFYLRRWRKSANVIYVIVGMFREFLLYGADQKFSIGWRQTSECATLLSFFKFLIPDFGGATSHI